MLMAVGGMAEVKSEGTAWTNGRAVEAIAPTRFLCPIQRLCRDEAVAGTAPTPMVGVTGVAMDLIPATFVRNVHNRM